MSKTPRRRAAIAAAVTVAITSAFMGLGITSPAQAACAAETVEAVSPGCGSTSSASPTPSPTDTDVQPTDSATASSGPTVTAAPSPTSVSPVSGPPTVHGVFTLGNGSALAGATVTLTATDSVPDDGTVVTPTVVGTTTTGTDGSWSYTLPASLPSDVQALADDNGGVLSLDAAYAGTASDGTLLTGDDYVDAGVATGTATTEGSAQARTESADTVAIHPDNDTALVTPADDPADANTDVDTATDEAATPTWQSADGTSTDGYNPDVVDGVDYSAVKPQIGVPSCGRSSHTVKTGIYYTTVGEAHAFYDTTAAFEYNDSLSSTWGVATSVDGKTWSITGKVSRKSSMGHATGFAGQGPNWAKRWRVPIEYKDVDQQVLCPGAKTKHKYSIVATRYKIPAGGAVGAYGADVSSKDGPKAYDASKSSYRAVLPKQVYFTLTHGASVTWGVAAKVFGVTISLDTEYGSQHYQKITAGSGKHEHDIWGAKGPVSGDPGVIYSY